MYKYQPAHKSSKSVPLNVVEVLIEILQPMSHTETKKDRSSEEETLMHVFIGVQSRKTIRLQGVCQGKELLLIDSENAGSFINAETVKQLGLNPILIPIVQVTVAGGGRPVVNKVVVHDG